MIGKALSEADVAVITIESKEEALGWGVFAYESQCDKVVLKMKRLPVFLS